MKHIEEYKHEYLWIAEYLNKDFYNREWIDNIRFSIREVVEIMQKFAYDEQHGNT